MTSPRACGKPGTPRSARAKAVDELVADRELLERVESFSDEARSIFRFSMGPLELPFDGFVGMRLNEHALHTWDIEVTIDPTATVPAESAAHIVDNLELIARFTARPTGSTRAIIVRTDQPKRDFSIELSPGVVTLGDGRSIAPARSRTSGRGVCSSHLREIGSGSHPEHHW